jgi:hypothetical protein
MDWLAPDAGRAGLDEGGKQMTDAEIKNLRDLMRAATPGPWRHEAWGSRILDSGVGSSQLLIATVAANTFRDQGRHNAEFIAACNPVAIRALLDRLKAAEGENERLREFERSAALTLPGVYYMDPPDGGDVSLLKQLQRSSIDAARYRWLRERAPFWAWQPDSNCYPGITVGFSHSETKYCDYTLDEAIDAAMKEAK